MNEHLSVLMIDDEPFTVDFLRERLREQGHEVKLLLLEDDFDALSKDQLRGYDLLILDIKIGALMAGEANGVSGQSAGVRMARRIRVDFRLSDRELKILAYSVVRDPTVKREMRSLQCAYMVKGDEAIISLLERVVSQVLRQKMSKTSSMTSDERRTKP